MGTLKQGLLRFLLTICLSQTIFSAVSPSLSDKFQIWYQFKQLDFEYPNFAKRKSDIAARVFIPGKPAPIDTDVYYPAGRNPVVFVTIPRFQDGIPATLGTVVLDKSRNPIIRPYPDWSWHKNPKDCNPSRIASVYRVMIDECNRLWVLDSGKIGDQVDCNPQLLAFDLRTNRLISKYEIPKDQWTINSTFVTPIVDIISRENFCENTYVYMADCIWDNPSIVVYDHLNRNSWIVQDETMKPDPKFEKFTIDGTSFDLLDGILGMSLTPFIPGLGRRLFYHAMSSDTEHYIKTSDLKNKYLWELKRPFPTLFKTYVGTRKTQSAAEAIDSTGVQYFGLIKNIEVACFATKGEYGIPGNYTDIVANNQQTLQFIGGMKVKNNPHNGDEELIIITSRFQRVITDTVKSGEINFRIQKASTSNLKAGTKCDQHTT
ncbi:dopaminechrome tautomerase-like [Diabrotica undecimpunctata]|uniref:dopaminechrome tautomerase-like n=1 Tax=Diabrotica undecimpunctata TaxID=50387 RepID=UPI003B636B48